MPSLISQQWQEKTSGFFSSSGTKLREAGQSAGSFVGEVAKDAKVNVADVAERVGTLFKSRWAILQQPATRHAVQEHLITAAATTGTLVRKGITETKEKVSVGKIKVEEAAKMTAQKSKTILTDIERWQKGVASSDVFGVAIEITVQRQESSRPIPFILIKCADYLILTGLNSPNLFKAEGDKKMIQLLVSTYNQDPSASIPEGVNPVDVAALIKYYLASLPTPLTTFELYSEIKDARSSIHRMRKSLQKLSNVNYNTLEFITALLLRVSQKSLLNKMDSHSLAMEMAPVIMWREDNRPESYREYWRRPSRSPKKSNDFETASPWDMLSDEGEGLNASSSISLDDIVQVDFGAVEVVQCLIEHHNAIFTYCFVRGCDGSVLINSTSGNAEKDATPNLTLRGFGFVERIKTLLESVCPKTVSCADIIALTARDAVVATGGPSWRVPTGRRDGRISNATEALNSIPAPTSNITTLQQRFANQGLNLKDLVLLSGAHTIGVSHCSSMSSRLYNFSTTVKQDPSLDSEYAANLKANVCKSLNDNTTILEMDPGSRKSFDLSYYRLVLKRRGLFQSDSALTTNSATLKMINDLVNGSEQKFYKAFAKSMEKMGRVKVKTGSSGVIRTRCSVAGS